jgi:uncharacterized repeat protein (TIGR02543 family)
MKTKNHGTRILLLAITIVIAMTIGSAAPAFADDEIPYDEEIVYINDTDDDYDEDYDYDYVDTLYNIKFNANGGKFLNKKKKSAEVWGSDEYKFPKVERKGKLLKGWYTKKKGGKRVTDGDTPDDVLPKNHTLYAHWKKVPKRYVTLKEYEKIKTGMTYKQVRKIIGGAGFDADGTVIAVYVGREYGSVVVSWTGNRIDTGASYCDVAFNHGRVADKYRKRLW